MADGLQVLQPFRQVTPLNWRKDDTWQQLHDQLRDGYRIEQGHQTSPSDAVIDSQSVKSTAGVQAAVGYDVGKQIKGHQRFLFVETWGLVRPCSSRR